MTNSRGSSSYILNLLKYPLHLESSLAILLFWFLMACYALGYSAIAYIPIGFSVGFLELVASSSLLCLFFEYGLEIIQASQTSAHAPPPLSYQTVRGKRFTQQVLFLTTLQAVAQYLTDQQLGSLAFILVLFYIVFLPAMQVVIATSHSFAEMINPVALLGAAWIMGWRYLAVLSYAALVAGFVYVVYASSLYDFLITAPITLYGLILLFRLLGLCYRDSQPVQIDADEVSGTAEEEQQAQRALTIQLGKLYEEKRSASRKQVYERLLTLARFNDWSRIDQIFDIVSAWDDKKPALWLVREYLSQLMNEENPMKAFRLCQWAQMWAHDFHPATADVLRWLQQHMVSDEQKRSFNLMQENYLAKEQSPGNVNREAALSAERDGL